ncbi:MAG: hypothetical protein LBT02_02640, partial [Rickettsiales bacterium]|nr:hypothetical protein [Rickettsiales bacterium]
MKILKYYIVLFFLFIGNVNAFSCSGQNCVAANDVGGDVEVVVEANPSLSQNGEYRPESNNGDYRTTQKAIWTDPKIATTGTPVIIRIRGKWIWATNNADKIEYVVPSGEYCSIGTSGVAETIGWAGHLDYLSALRRVERQGNGQILFNAPISIKSAPYQQVCYLTAGEGLYIAFFGGVGTDMPELATHLKVADVICPDAYKSDKNGDGVFTMDECYDKTNEDRTNLSYYAGSYNASNGTTTFVSCNEDYLQGTVAQKAMFRAEGKLVPNICYHQLADGLREDMTEFFYTTDYFFKNSTRLKVGAGERVKFMIYDQYYSDNAGYYTLNLRGGFSSLSGDGGIIEVILNDLETFFVGKSNENGIRQGGMLHEMYNSIVRNSNFAL